MIGLVTMGNSMFAQQNLGAACGCPTVATRSTAAITSVGTWTTLPSSAYGKELGASQNITLTCDKIWTLDEKLYIASGSTLTIEPGTVIFGDKAVLIHKFVVIPVVAVFSGVTVIVPVALTVPQPPVNGIL